MRRGMWPLALAASMATQALEPVSPALLEYMGRWQDDAGEWIDPLAFDEAWLAEGLVTMEADDDDADE